MVDLLINGKFELVLVINIVQEFPVEIMPVIFKVS